MKRTFKTLLGLTLILQGCAPTIIGGGATVATAAAEERGVSGVWDDGKIKAQIAWKLSQEGSSLFADVDVVVRQGRVLLTGTVKNPEDKVRAVNLSWKVKGVREVVDEISTTHKITLANYSKDTWITTKVKSAMLFDNDVTSVNYNVQTINGVVYLMGVAPSRKDMDAAVHKAASVSGVKEVVNHIQLKQPEK